jgi:ATP-dependent Clp protease protease subunit
MKFWNFIANADDTVDLRLDGEIVSDDDAWIYEWFGIKVASPNAFREALAEHKGKNITVWIDSWGGDVFAGVGMYNALKEHKGKVTVKVDGKAVSAASIVAMAGAEILMSPGSIMMVHNPWSGVQGEAKDMRHTADVLDEVKTAIVNVYEIRTSKKRDDIAALMDRETWMSAKTAVAEGFADGILYTDTGTVQNAYTLSGLAIQNSAAEAMRKFFEVFQQQHKPEADPAKCRVCDIKKRVNVREKQNRRAKTWENSKNS